MKQCKHCNAGFEITNKDRDFYNEMEVDEPTLCYICRFQRRLSYRNERFLYHRKCDLTGKQAISSFSLEKPFPVYDNDAWWSDDWDPLDYGRDFDFSRTFFDQYFELRNQVPRIARQQQKPIENSDYCNCVSRNKNCYLVFSTNHCEDCYYGSWVNYCKNCLDNKNISHSELCYNCVGCRESYNIRYSWDSINCKNSAFLRNCQGCADCFVCSNLIDKKYYIFNKPYTKESYEEFMKEVDLGSHKVVERIKEKYNDAINDLVVKEFHGVNNENSLGDYLTNCKNCFMCFECDDCEDMRYCECIEQSKTAMDWSHWGQNCERMYECQACGYDNFNLRFCNLCWQGCANLTYCDQMFASKDCFGCVGLKRKQYCILNKQYTKNEYEKLIPKIIEYMKETKEWSEFFGLENSIYAYNETLANERVPLTKDEIISKGWIYNDTQKDKSYKGPIYEIPDNIQDVDDDILKQILISEQSGIPYKIIPQELSFYRKMGIPIPHFSPDERHFNRLKKRNPIRMWDRNCDKCSKDIKTTFSPDRSEKVYCEECYLNEIY